MSEAVSENAHERVFVPGTVIGLSRESACRLANVSAGLDHAASAVADEAATGWRMSYCAEPLATTYLDPIACSRARPDQQDHEYEDCDQHSDQDGMRR